MSEFPKLGYLFPGWEEVYRELGYTMHPVDRFLTEVEKFIAEEVARLGLERFVEAADFERDEAFKQGIAKPFWLAKLFHMIDCLKDVKNSELSKELGAAYLIQYYYGFDAAEFHMKKIEARAALTKKIKEEKAARNKEVRDR